MGRQRSRPSSGSVFYEGARRLATVFYNRKRENGHVRFPVGHGQGRGMLPSGAAINSKGKEETPPSRLGRGEIHGLSALSAEVGVLLYDRLGVRSWRG